MDCNREEALRAKEIAEKKMESRDFMGARKFALKAQQLHHDLENIAQMLVVCDVHCSSQQRLFGNEMDWYEILQLEQTANDAMIKKQYRKFALQLHPDKNKFAGAEAAFKLIGEAQRVLLDRERRSKYDVKRRVSMNKTAMSSHNPLKVPMNFNSAMKTNVKPNFANSNSQQQQQQQQQYKQPVQLQQNGGRPTFWTICPFCSVKYQYYREVLNKSLRCQHCSRPFIAYDVGWKGTSSTTNSSQQPFGQQKDGLNHDASRVGVESQGNLHAEKSNTGPYQKKSPVDVSKKPHGKRKRNQVSESNQSSGFMSSTDSEGDMAVNEDGFPGAEKHSTCREKQPRRSPRQKHKVSYKENVNDNDDGFLRPSKSGKESGSSCGDDDSLGGTTKMNDQNGLAANLKDEHKEVKQKKDFHSVESSHNRNEETTRVRGNEAMEGSKQMDETSEHFSPDSPSKAIPNAYVYPDAEFSDFDKDKKEECFAAGQIWAIYDTIDGMPRFYALIRKRLSPGFKLRITWFEPHPVDNDEINWVNKKMPVACGKYKLANTEITDDHLMFSHLVTCEKIGHNTYKVYPRKGETWALFRNWDIKWYMDAESHKQYEYEFVEILSDYVEGEGVYVAYLAKLKGFVSLFLQSTKDRQSFQIPPRELFRFSHRVPSFKMTGLEGVGVYIGSYELDPGSLPIEEIADPENFDVKICHDPSGGGNARLSERLNPPMASDGDVSNTRVNLERSELTENKDSVNDINDCDTPQAFTQEAIEIPDAQFFNFDAAKSVEKFQIGQIWAFYSDEDGLPKYYGRINRVETSPDLELHISWLTCCWLPDNASKWEDKDMLISCGRFKVMKTDEFRSVYTDTSSISHQVHAETVGMNKNYAIFPRIGEVWALYKKWSNKIRISDLKNWEYDIVEVLEETDLFINVLVFEFVSGFSSIFRGKSNEGSSVNLRIPRKELLRFSHQIPAFKLTEEHGNLRGCWELDPGALPIHCYASR